MSTVFPTSLDSFTNPAGSSSGGTDKLNTVGVVHGTQHQNINDAITAVEAKVGINSSAVTTSLDYLLKSTSSLSPGHKHTIAEATGTKAQFDTACTDGNFLYVGDVTQYTDEMAQDAVGGMAANSARVTLTYADATPSLTPDLVANSITAGYLSATATDKLFGRSTASAGAGEEIACTAAGRALLDDADASAQRTTLGLGTLATQSATITDYLLSSTAASTYQPLDSDLTTIAGLTATTDNFIVSVSSAWASRTPAQVRTTLGLVIGTNVQAYDADLTTWAGITPGANVGTFLATPSSANLLAALTDETGTGALVFGTSPTIVTPTIAKLANLTTNGFVKTSAGDGTLSVDTSVYLNISPRNALINGAMRVAQAGTSFASIGSTSTFTLDGWMALAFAGNATVSQQALTLTNGFTKLIRIQRANGNTVTNAHVLTQTILSADTTQYAGQPCVLSFYARCGANFSPTSSLMGVTVGIGTGTDQGSAGMQAVSWTGFANALVTSQAITTTLTRYSFTVTPSSTATEMGISLSFTPVGTAGAADYLEITGVQFEIGSVATAFEYRSWNDDLDACLPFYTKTFPYATAPAQNAGVTGALTVKNPIALGDPSETWHFKRIMRSIPVITTYNPSASNANWRDITAAADSTVSVNPGSTLGTDMVMIATSGTVTTLGDILAIHATADSRL